MKLHHGLLTAVFAFGTMFGTAALAEPPAGKGKGKPDRVEKSSTETVTDAVLEQSGFSDEERRVIKTVLNGVFGSDATEDDEGSVVADGSSMPPGLKKYYERTGRLPPGLQKQLDERGTLPPGLARRDLPSDIKAQLPNHDDGTEIVVGLDDNVYLIDEATRVIIDVIKDAITR